MKKSGEESGYRIASIGSASPNLDEEAYKKAREIGKYLGKDERVSILNSGGCIGISERLAEGAMEEGLKTVGYSPGANLEEHVEFGEPDVYDEFVFLSDYLKESEIKDLSLEERFKYRIPPMISASDAVIGVSGSVGTSTEILTAWDMGKEIALLKGSGGAADNAQEYIEEVGGLSKRGVEKTGEIVVHEKNPEKLVQELLDKLDEK